MHSLDNCSEISWNLFCRSHLWVDFILLQPFSLALVIIGKFSKMCKLIPISSQPTCFKKIWAVWRLCVTIYFWSTDSIYDLLENISLDSELASNLCLLWFLCYSVTAKTNVELGSMWRVVCLIVDAKNQWLKRAGKIMWTVIDELSVGWVACLWRSRKRQVISCCRF